MENKSPLTVVRDFIEDVNHRDLGKVNSCVSNEIKFTDIQGRVYIEPEFMENYLKAYPDYKIHSKHFLQGGDGVAIVGLTSGSHVPQEVEENEVLVWTAEVKGNLITEWRIYSTEKYASAP